MGRYVSLLRAVNVGGRNKIGGPALRQVYAGAGMGDVTVVLQSGNVLFSCDLRSALSCERVLEQGLAGLGLETDVIVRSAAEWHDAIAANPFPGEAESDPSHLVLMCLKGTGAPAAEAYLQKAIKGP